MPEAKKSLFKIYPAHLEVPLLLLGSAVLLFYGLQLPVITMEQLIFWKSNFSILNGIQNLVDEKEYLIALVIFLFSVVFPTTKTLSLTAIWFAPLSGTKRARAIQWTSNLGKWSMLDVFVLAIVIVLTKATPLTKAEPRVGLYVFTASVILSMLAVLRIESLAHKTKKIQS